MPLLLLRLPVVPLPVDPLLRAALPLLLAPKLKVRPHPWVSTGAQVKKSPTLLGTPRSSSMASTISQASTSCKHRTPAFSQLTFSLNRSPSQEATVPVR
jgi:hypothetical protein